MCQEHTTPSKIISGAKQQVKMTLHETNKLFLKLNQTRWNYTVFILPQIVLKLASTNVSVKWKCVHFTLMCVSLKRKTFLIVFKFFIIDVFWKLYKLWATL